LNKSMPPDRHYRESGNPVSPVFPGFRLALAIVSLAGMTTDAWCEFLTHHARRHMSAVNAHIKIVTVAAIFLSFTVALSASSGETLPEIKPAPEFTLTNQDGKRLALGDLRGKVVAITFIFASCADTCPLLTAKMADIQNHLGSDFGQKVYFVSITVDPERDTPEVLKRYAEAHKANPAGWAFLTGTPGEIRDVAKHYGIYYKKTARGDVDHTFLTSLVDQNGTLRVQYMGVRFNPDEMLGDLQSLMREEKAR
jgi:protein SCO1